MLSVDISLLAAKLVLTVKSCDLLLSPKAVFKLGGTVGILFCYCLMIVGRLILFFCKELTSSHFEPFKRFVPTPKRKHN